MRPGNLTGSLGIEVTGADELERTAAYSALLSALLRGWSAGPAGSSCLPRPLPVGAVGRQIMRPDRQVVHATRGAAPGGA
ncbi:hypothetical protein JOD49_002173 [Oerskovia jenensis]|uniref:Uncharacterized protein n=1 Tax=Oerskovia jenensis TaxID=162169 RepID=A0ABS2LGK9_9CELL|nr:hypothetical protein [Oerskovia jenensis]